MPAAIIRYLENVRSSLRLAPAVKSAVISELEAHAEDRLDELREEGLNEEEAVNRCLGYLGSAGLAARQIYEAHSQGTWKQSLLASVPHLVFSLLFILDWWQYPLCLTGALVAILIVTVSGWLCGKPVWMFSCLGYSFLPVLAVGIILLYLPRGWSLLALPLYFSLALWWLAYIVNQTLKNDWLFTSLMLLPLPILASWFLVLSPEAQINSQVAQRIDAYSPWIALSFLVLAGTIAIFMRIRQRRLKIALLVLSGLLTATVVYCYATDKLGLPALLLLILTTWGIFLIPPLLERRLRARGNSSASDTATTASR